MLSKIDRKVRHILSGQAEELKIPTDIRNNPLVTYLRLFQNQHKVITILYKGLITAFSGFVLLLSFLIYNVLHNNLIPPWGAMLLAVTDFFLIYGVYKAFRELHRYRSKSTMITEQIFSYLKKDLDKLEKIQIEHSFLKDSQKRVHKTKSRSLSSLHPVKGEHEGWDFKRCHHCGASIEMLEDVCPICQHNQKIYLEN